MAQEHKGDFCPRCGEQRLFLRDLHNSRLAIHIIISIFFWPWLFVLLIVALCSSPRWLCTKCGGPPLSSMAYRQQQPMMMPHPQPHYLPPPQQGIDVPQSPFAPVPPPLENFQPPPPPPVPRIAAPSKPMPPKPAAPQGPGIWQRFLDSL